MGVNGSDAGSGLLLRRMGLTSLGGVGGGGERGLSWYAVGSEH